MKHGSLFSGIGGFDLAAQWMGWENVFHCEWNPFGQKVLKHYWPEAISYSDITKTDFTPHANSIDILTGGFPCQPYSTAGKRKGKEDERHLWPEMLRAIREVSPRWVVGENVRGLTNWNGGMVFDEVQADLEAEGYEVLPFLLPACAVNAPHRRDRIWFVAHAEGRGTRENERGLWSKRNGRGEGFENDARFGSIGEYGNASNAGLQRQKKQQQQTERIIEYSSWWQGFPTVAPLCSGNDGFPTGLAEHSLSKGKWRTESIKAAGNAIVPQVAYEHFKAIEAYESSIELQNVHEFDATKSDQGTEPLAP